MSFIEILLVAFMTTFLFCLLLLIKVLWYGTESRPTPQWFRLLFIVSYVATIGWWNTTMVMWILS